MSTILEKEKHFETSTKPISELFEMLGNHFQDLGAIGRLGCSTGNDIYIYIMYSLEEGPPLVNIFLIVGPHFAPC